VYDIMITKLTYLKLISLSTQHSQADSHLSKGIKGQSGQGDPIKLIRLLLEWLVHDTFAQIPILIKQG